MLNRSLDQSMNTALQVQQPLRRGQWNLDLSGARPGTTTSVPEVTSGDTRKHKEISDGAHAASLVAIDFALACLAVPVTLVILAKTSSVSANSLSHLRTNLAKDAALPPAIVIGLAASGLYRPTRHALRPSVLRQLKDLVFAIGTGCVIALALGLVVHLIWRTQEPSSTQLLSAIPVASVLIILGRMAFQAHINASVTSRVLVVGSGVLTDRIATCIRVWGGMELVGRVTPEDTEDSDVLGSIKHLPRLCDELSVDRVIVGFPDDLAAISMDDLRDLQQRIHISVVPRYFDLISFRTQLVDLLGIPMLEMPPVRISQWNLGLKRVFDVVISLISIILLSPLLVALSIIIAVTSPGPVLYRQERMGYKRKPFIMYKFRTMSHDGAAESVDVMNLHHFPLSGSGTTTAVSGPTTTTTMVSDPLPTSASVKPLHVLHNKAEEKDRITTIGRILRPKGLDELPQLFNVLRGNMSIVGPRPFVAAESIDSGDWRARRFDVRPGITGLWQVSGRNDLLADDLFALDYVYVTGWSVWLDLKIIWETPRAMMRGFGAY